MLCIHAFPRSSFWARDKRQNENMKRKRDGWQMRCPGNLGAGGGGARAEGEQEEGGGGEGGGGEEPGSYMIPPTTPV